ncbi:cupin domain-containing protein [Paraherbaspirillum soli]|uniref:Cupin domain-containing protein n=1 Tax=Paraherbaspirillum soli TaxID=631222 RepID=A0ABW0M5Q3_9BURK
MKTASAQPASHGSSDFWRVGSKTEVVLPARLHHPDVLAIQAAGAAKFSAERKHPVHIVDLPTKTLNMTIGGLLPSQTTSRHRHNYETVIYVIEGKGITTIEDRTVEWQAGDAVYIPVWAWHHHTNASASENCLYIACENAALLQNLGGIALREEAGD